VAKWL